MNKNSFLEALRNIFKKARVADVESIIRLATTQNFVPVVDDEGIFIGIIKRSDIINYCYNAIKKEKKLL